ncbi:MAG: hypothetical protein BGP11_19320 [Rhodobacterales bacterium 65-51]|uniref:glycosyltransferase family 2 protein n=1 Tax=uncultured Gemmobacter sp. TaxID=1095917 RepID=UPI000959C6D2|nr:glycosyltransferase [uncultured Gemmobacter sp.]OJY28923.1 MAG: hypothetical protein BGP11_19320 [Rhodobacterales bacterium 65-51]
MSLSLVIPVWNDPEGLIRLLIQAQELGWVSEIIVVDDASDLPCGPDMPGLPQAVAEDTRLVWLRSDRRRGAGHARNLGLERAQGAYLLFFDSDDLFLPAMRDLMDALEGPMARQDFDFCLFRHRDSRESPDHDPMPDDSRIWRSVGATDQPGLLPAGLAPVMVQIAAYPWNKVYRTAFLRDHDLRCTEIMVHNDIALHWLGFLKAERILVSTLRGCEHVVSEEGNRLTNQRDAERFTVFEALETVQAALRQEGRPFLAPFAGFCLRLFDWIGGTLNPELRQPFAERARDHLRQSLDRGSFTLIALEAPGLAARLLARMQGRAA